MSVVTYNDVVLPYADILSFRQKALRDTVGDTDWYLTEFDITVQCLISTDYLTVLAPDLVGVATNPADIMQVLRARLLQHRKLLSVTFNGRELIPQRQVGVPGTVDADNGPKPQDCTYIMLTNVMYIMRFSITARYWENNGGNIEEGEINNQPSSPVLFNRWTETVNIDHKNYTTRSRQGKFVIRSDNLQGYLADQIRSQMAVVGVPSQAFLRRSSQYRVDPSGLGIEYHVVDQEVFKKPPAPAFMAKGYYRESTTINGAKRYGECFVHLEGDRGTPQADLCRVAVAVVSGKMAKEGERITGKAGIGFHIIENAVLHLDMYDNEVEFSMRALIPADKNRLNPSLAVQAGGGHITSQDNVNPIAAFTEVGTDTPRSGDDVPYIPAYLDRGTSSLFLQAARYYDPNLFGNKLGPGSQRAGNTNTTTGDNANVQMTKGFDPGTAGKTRED